MRVLRARERPRQPAEVRDRPATNCCALCERDRGATAAELGAIYHSHVRSAPYPSQTDVNFAANWPGVEWIIVGLSAGAEPEVRSYLIEGGAVREVPIARRGRVSEEPLVCPSCGRALSARASASARTARCRWCSTPGGEPPASSERQRRARKIKPQYAEGALVKVARAAEPARGRVHRGAAARGGHPEHAAPLGGVDVPDFLAAGRATSSCPSRAREAAREALAGTAARARARRPGDRPRRGRAGRRLRW